MSVAAEPVGGASTAAEQRGGQAPPLLSRSWPLLGHLNELRKRPIELFQRVRDELGEIGELNFAGNRVVMLMGEEAQEAFFRGTDEQLDQAAAYPFMTPVFGKGVVFDGTPEQRKQALRNQSLTAPFMEAHAETITFEVRRMMEGLGEEGEIDLLDFFAELTIYTSSACLIGKEFREELTPEYFKTFYELEKGTDALAYVNPSLPLPVFRARDRRLGRIVALKRLSENLRDHAHAVQLFMREAQAAAALNHPNIVTIYDVDQDDGAQREAHRLKTGPFGAADSAD